MIDGYSSETVNNLSLVLLEETGAKVETIGAGYSFSELVTVDHQFFTAGNNERGQLGHVRYSAQVIAGI